MKAAIVCRETDGIRSELAEIDARLEVCKSEKKDLVKAQKLLVRASEKARGDPFALVEVVNRRMELLSELYGRFSFVSLTEPNKNVYQCRERERDQSPFYREGMGSNQ